MAQLVIEKRESLAKATFVIRVGADAYAEIERLAALAHKSVSEVATEMLLFAAKNATVRESKSNGK